MFDIIEVALSILEALVKGLAIALVVYIVGSLVYSGSKR